MAQHRYQFAWQMHDDLLLLIAGKSVLRTRALERRLKIVTRLGTVTAAVLMIGAVPFYMAIKEAKEGRCDNRHAQSTVYVAARRRVRRGHVRMPKA